MTAASGVHVKSLDHVTIVVKDLAATRRFYVDALGMVEVPRPAFSFAGQWFQAGATMIHTILEFEGSAPAGLGGGLNARGYHFAFLVDDVASSIAQLAEMGVMPISPPRPRPDGAGQVFYRDPDGHLVELSSPPA